jgi:hypothetical protein
MSNKKPKKIAFNHGGPRPGAGHPETGITKTKICVSVTGQIWESAQSRWNGKASHLVDRLLMRFVANEVNPPPNFDMRIPDTVRKCVVYLGVGTGSSVQNIHYGGTGFFIAKTSKKAAGASFLFLVTAKHVAEELIGKQFYVRVNTTNGKFMHLQVANDLKWYFHPTDNAADVALVPVALDPNQFDFLPLSSEMVLTDETRQSKGIGAGDEVFIIGLSVFHKRNGKNIPIIRIGNIAMVPGERIYTDKYGEMDAYLIESRSLNGLSGSPVFTIARFPELGTIYLLGLINGHWNVSSKTIVDEITQDTGIPAGVNVGIAIVTPASKIVDILNSDELITDQAKIEVDELSKNSPTPYKT